MTNQTYPGASLMTNEDYHANTSHISKSGLDLISQTPAHYYAHYLDPSREKDEPTPALKLGSAVHAAILEPELFANEYWAVDDAAIISEIGGAKPRATARYREWLLEKERQNAGKEMLTADQFKHCLRMRDAVWSHPGAAYLLNDGYREQSFFFTDPMTDAPCKIRPDFLNPSIRWITDVKTTEDASPAAFGRSFYNYRYHVQAAFILDGLAAIEGAPWQGIAFIAVEKNPPYAVAVYYATPEDIADGRVAYRGNLLTYMECKQRNQWPAYSTKIEPIMRPAWMRS